MRRRPLPGLILLVAAAVLAACGVAASASDAARSPGASPGTGTAATTHTVRTTHTIKAGGRTRSWVQVTAPGTASGSAPIIVVLSGIHATPSQEIARDGLVPLAASGSAELVYPAGVGKSWNAGGCCGVAAKENVNDVAFLQALVAQLDPGHRQPVYLAGYSNGGRLAYRVACTDPGLFGAIAVLKAMPEPGCVVSQPVTIMQIDATNDPTVPYQPGDPGREQPAATTEVARLQSADGCTGPPAVVTEGSLRLETWTGCTAGTRLAFAVYQGGKHTIPLGNATTPSAASIIWTFFSASGPG
jgi:polyhydroxybutyrate depolymerase